MREPDAENILAAIAALESQRATLGDAVLALALAPLQARLAEAQRPAGLRHRQVAVLFADVVGSTAMSQALQTEDTHALMSGAMQRMADIVQAHRGRVLRFTGDGVKAAFGIERTREDDAERAVRAGLAMLAAGREQAEAARRAHGIEFAVRIGVHCGDVALGDGVEADNTAIGAAVNIAARMEQSAPPGALRISHDTWIQVRGLFELEPQPPLEFKGVAAPLQTWLVRAALDRATASVERGLQGLATPMVGREAELQRLLQAVARVGEQGRLQAITLLGDAGLGKSRLLRELRAALASHVPAARVQQVRLQPDGQLRPWGLLQAWLALQFAVADTDSAELARAKVVEGLVPCLAEEGERGEGSEGAEGVERTVRTERQAHLIGQLAGLDFTQGPHVRGLDPRSLRDQALAAFRRVLQHLAAPQPGPLLLLVEDLHWADEGSLDLLQDLLSHADTLPLVLVMTARPALLARRPGWGAPDNLTLAPLATAQGEALVQALLSRLPAVPPALAELLVSQAEGNPYYLEELVRRLIDEGVIVVDATNASAGEAWTLREDRQQQLHLPPTLVGLLQARLDALPVAERQAAREASVIGHVFWDDALQALDARAPDALPALQRAAFVHTQPSSAVEGTLQRQFDHHLLHQVTYDTLLKSERRHGHAAAARWLAERTRGRGPEFLAMTGEHAERAGDVALAADCFEQAATEARQRYANAAAMDWLRRAATLLGEAEPARRFDLFERLQTIADQTGDRAAQQAAQEDMARVLDRHTDDVRRARLLYVQGLLADRRSDVAGSERLCLEAFELAERCGAAYTAASAQGNRAWLRLARQDHRGAEGLIASGLHWAARIDDAAQRAEIEAKLFTLQGIIAVVQCRFDEARQTLQAVLARGQQLGLPRLQLGALDNLAMVACYLGHWDQAMAHAERMIPLAKATGAPPDLAGAHLRLGQAAGCAGDVAAAIRWHQLNLPVVRAIGNRRQEAAILRMLGGACRAQDDVVQAWQWHAQAAEVHRQMNEPLEACENEAEGALCQLLLHQRETALAMVNALLLRLQGEHQGLGDQNGQGDLAALPAAKTLELRWFIQQVLAALGDARADALLEQLFNDMQAQAAVLTDAADRERLIQALPVFRGIAAAHAG